ncbi:hypothetical protein XELAEV_18037028mg, partial [Xenopus laevis]
LQGSAGVDAVDYFEGGCTHTNACKRQTQHFKLRTDSQYKSVASCRSTLYCRRYDCYQASVQGKLYKSKYLHARIKLSVLNSKVIDLFMQKRI